MPFVRLYLPIGITFPFVSFLCLLLDLRGNRGVKAYVMWCVKLKFVNGYRKIP